MTPIKKRFHSGQIQCLLPGLFALLIILTTGSKPFELTNLALLPDPVRFTIYDPTSNADSSFYLMDKNSLKISEPVYGEIFYFWNHSAFPVNGSDITEPIVLSLDNPKGRILSLSLLNSTDGDDLVRLTRSPENPEKAIQISFEKLHSREGVAFQIVYTGAQDAEFQVKGSTRGMMGIATDYRQTVKPFWGQYGKIIGLCIIAVILVSLYIYRKRRLARQKHDETTLLSPIKKTTTAIFLRVLLFGFIVLLLWLLVVQPLIDAQNRPYKLLYKSIPESLVP